jgi:hypothetical protein
MERGEERNAFTFYRSYYEAARELPDEQRLALYDAFIPYALDGIEPDISGITKAMFILIKPVLDTSKKRAKAGELGGSSKANNKQTESKSEAKRKQTPSKPKADSKQTESDISDDKEIDIDEDIDNDVDEDNTPLPPASGGRKKSGKPKTPPKTQYAEFVSMTNDEHSSLVTELGEQGARRCIEILDNYKGSSGKTYKSDYRAILNWVIKRYEEERQKPQPGTGYSPTFQPRQNTGGKVNTMDVLNRILAETEGSGNEYE